MMLIQAAADSVQVVSFNIISPTGKKEDYAMPIEQVREIRAVEKITKVPRSEPFVLGIMNLRGLIIPVIDVKKKLGLDSQNNSNSKQRILVADINGSLTGLLVDEVDQVIKIPTQEIEQPPAGAFDSYHYVRGIAKVSDKLVILLDVESLLGGQKHEEQQKPKATTTQNMPKEPAIESTENLDNPTIQSIDDIPPELAEVFKEDEQGIPPTQIIRN